ncbi:hypothetical protein H8D30_06665 [bacterium]|nr:hypothetical protein [bacterium]
MNFIFGIASFEGAEGIGIWLAAFLTLAILSFLWGDNPFFKFAEHLYVGIGAGYLVVVAWHNDIATNVVAPVREGYALVQGGDGAGWSNILNPILACVVGSFLFFPVVAPKLRWLTRYAFAFILGSFSGIKAAVVVKANLVVQAEATIRKACAVSKRCAEDAGLVHTPEIGAIVSAVVILVLVLCGLVYFFFSLEHKGPVRVVARIGIYGLMVGFGASFGLTVMGRVSLLIGRLQFLFEDWLGILGG